MNNPLPVVVVGAGLAGLSCAHALSQKSVPVLLLEAADHPGGRVWTDLKDGFLLDRGFQVLNPGYPALLPWLQYLTLKPFKAGARIRLKDGSFTSVMDPLRHPLDSMNSLLSPVGGLKDKLMLLKLQRLAAEGLPLDLGRLAGPSSVSADSQLQQWLSEPFQRQFIRPFFGGVLLESGLRTRWDYWLWLYRLFSLAQVTLPAGGMKALPTAMAAQLPSGCLKLNTPVKAVQSDGVTLADDTFIPAQTVVVTTDGLAACRLLNLPFQAGQRSVTCLYYAWPGDPPSREPLLWLNGQGEGLINNLCFNNTVQPDYAPDGYSLLSVSVLGLPTLTNADLDRLVQAELAAWFGAKSLSLLQIYHIPFAQPDNIATEAEQPLNVQGIWLAGDWVSTPSLQGALSSGVEAANRVYNQLNK